MKDVKESGTEPAQARSDDPDAYDSPIEYLLLKAEKLHELERDDKGNWVNRAGAWNDDDWVNHIPVLYQEKPGSPLKVAGTLRINEDDVYLFELVEGETAPMIPEGKKLHLGTILDEDDKGNMILKYVLTEDESNTVITGVDENGKPIFGIPVLVMDNHDAVDVAHISIDYTGSLNAPKVKLGVEGLTMYESGVHVDSVYGKAAESKYTIIRYDKPEGADAANWTKGRDSDGNECWKQAKTDTGSTTCKGQLIAESDAARTVDFTFSMTPNDPANWTQTINGDDITWTHKAGTFNGTTYGEGFVTLTYNTQTGKYHVEMNDADAGVQSLTQDKTFKVDFKVQVHDDTHNLDSKVEKTLTVTLTGTNDIPVLSVKTPHKDIIEDNADHNAKTWGEMSTVEGVLDVSTGKAKEDDGGNLLQGDDQSASKTYFIIKDAAAGHGGVNPTNFSSEQLAWNEGNFHNWLETLAAQGADGLQGNAGAAAATFLNFNNINNSKTIDTIVYGKYGTLIIDNNGKYTYTANKAVRLGEGEIGEDTLHHRRARRPESLRPQGRDL